MVWFVFNQMNKLTIDIYSNQSNIIIHHHLKLGTAMMHRRFFSKYSHKIVIMFKLIVQKRNNPFHFACRKWYLFKNLIKTRIQIQIKV